MKEDNWEHRNTYMKCRTCMWYVSKEPEVNDPDINKVGRCRRHAPTMNGYPAVFELDWCGDHKIDETKLIK